MPWQAIYSVLVLAAPVLTSFLTSFIRIHYNILLVWLRQELVGNPPEWKQYEEGTTRIRLFILFANLFNTLLSIGIRCVLQAMNGFERSV